MEQPRISLTALCADICACANVNPPETSEKSSGILKKLCGDTPCDRVIMYNPDAQAEWLVKKYPNIFEKVASRSRVQIEFSTVMPSVTPVCFATMYTGLFPEVHGIRKYEKPILKCETIFDSFISVGKKCAIVATEGSSIANIFLDREMDYYIIPADASGDEKAVIKGIELINEDKYDLLVIYNGMYDSVMHASSPEAEPAMEWLYHHTGAYERIYESAKTVSLKNAHKTLIGYATDHGVHTNDSGRGAHGLDIPEDIEIRHFYDFI